MRLVDPARGGRDAIGAEVRLRADEQKWWGVLQPATSYLVSHEPTLYFGFGAVTNVETAEIVWAEGDRELFEIGPVDRTVVLKKGSGKRN